MTSQLMECCQDRVRMVHCHIEFVKIKYMGLTFNMVKKCLGLIAINVFSHKTNFSLK